MIWWDIWAAWMHGWTVQGKRTRIRVVTRDGRHVDAVRGTRRFAAGSLR